MFIAIAIEENFLLHHLPYNLFSMLKKAQMVKISRNSNLAEIPPNLKENLTNLRDLRLSGTKGTQIRLPPSLLDKT